MASKPSPPDERSWNRQRVAAVLPADDLPFEALSARYNFENISDRSRVFTRLIIKECQSRTGPRRVLDIGCGKGIELYVDLQWAIREHVEEFWGLEPDASIAPIKGLFDHFLNDLMESATLPEAHFDVAYSFMVMEHVTDPHAFMRAVMRCLKPGGVCIFATPNGRHYFTRTASLLRALKLDERVLRLAKPASEVEEYHYPVQYRFNSEGRINACAQALGCPPPEYVYLEERGPIGYFPWPTRFIYHGLRLKRKTLRNRRSLVTMLCRMRKP